MRLSPIEKNAIFLYQMETDYRNKRYSEFENLEPYFIWKFKGGTRENLLPYVYDLMATAVEACEVYYDRYPDAPRVPDLSLSDDPWKAFVGYGKDKYIVSYLETICDDLTRLSSAL